MFNSVFLIGNLGADPEIRSVQTGKKVAKFNLAVHQARRGPTGEWIEKTMWITCTAWDRQADTCERYLRKGSKIALRGSLDYQEWKAQDGSKRSKIEVVIRELENLSPRPGESKPPVSKESSSAPTSSEDNYDPMNHYASGPDEPSYQDDFSPSASSDNIPF